MLKQTDFKLSDPHTRAIHDYGCYFMSIIFMFKPALLETDDVRGVLALYAECVARGYMTSNCYVLQPCAIVSRLGVNVDDRPAWSSDPASDGPCIVRFTLRGTSHFAVIDASQNVVYDPWENSNAVRYGTRADYRVFRRSHQERPK